MNAGLQAVIFGRRRIQATQTFTANATWTAPLTTSRIDSASGYGAAGDPATPDTTQSGWQQSDITISHRRDGSTEQYVSGTYPPVFDGSPRPTGYNDPTVYYTTDQSTVYSDSTVFHEFVDATRTVPGNPATTGASTTAFGRDFPGGTGGAAGVTTASTVAVTPGASYSIVVPAGGSLTIIYFQ